MDFDTRAHSATAPPSVRRTLARCATRYRCIGIGGRGGLGAGYQPGRVKRPSRQEKKEGSTCKMEDVKDDGKSEVKVK